MQPLRLELVNLRQHKNTVIFFPKTGLIGFTGDNGAGKSTLFNSMDWILYGKFKDSPTKESLKTQGLPKNAQTYGMLDFLYADDFYRVRRDLASSTTKNFVQKNGMTVAAGTTNVNEYIRNLFKMDQEAFRVCYYASQDDFDALAKLNDSPRVQMISKLLRLESIDKAAEQARKKRNSLEIELEEARKHLKNDEELNAKIVELNEELQVVFDEIKKIESSISSLEKEKESISEQKIESDNKHSEHQKVESQISNLETKIKTLTQHSLASSKNDLAILDKNQERLNEIKHLKDEYFVLLQKKDEMQTQREQYMELQRISREISETNETMNKYKEAIAYIDNKLLEFNETEQTIQSLENGLQEKEHKASLISNKLQETLTLLNVNKQRYQDIIQERRQFEQLGEDVPCPTCKRPLGEHFENHLGELEEKRQSIISETASVKQSYDKLVEADNSAKQEISNLKEQLKLHNQSLIQKSSYVAKRESASSELVKRNEQLNRLNETKASLPSISFNPDEYNQLLQKITSLVPIYEDIIQLQKSVEDIPKVKKAIEDIEADIHQSQEEVLELKEQLNSIGFNKEHHLELQRKSNELYQLLDDTKNLKYQQQIKHNNIANQIENLERELKENESKRLEIKDKQYQIVKYTKLNQLFKAYKTDKLAKLSPALSDLMSDMMDVITDGRYSQVKLDDNYNISIYRQGVAKPLDIFSGGEKKLAALCQRIAISQMLVSQTGQASFDMIALDEVFGSMDAKRQDSMIELFRSLNQIFPQILIVSHSDNVKDLFDHTLHIEYNNDGTSTCKWLNNAYGNPTFNQSEIEEIVDKYTNLEESA